MKYDIEYIENNHIYLINGLIVSSVTQLLRKKFNKMYENIPPGILINKAEFGNHIHKAIEMIEKKQYLDFKQLSPYEELCINEYLILKNKYCIKSIKNEMLVHFKDKYAGRLDLIAMVNNKTCLCDIKTTAKLDKKYLSWQLSLYEYALISMGHEPMEKLYCIWLPRKQLGQLIEIQRVPKDLLEEFIKENC